MGLDRVGEGGGIEPGLAAGNSGVAGGAVMAAKLMVRSDELRILRCARCVDSRGRRADGKGRTADVAKLSGDLEATEDGAGEAVVEEHLAAAEREVIDAPELEVVGAVVAGLGAVQVEVAGIGISRAAGTRTRTVICIVKCVRPGIVQAVLILAACIVRQLRLQGVVVGAEDRLVHGDAAGVIADIAGGGVAMLLVDDLVGVERAGSGEAGGRIVLAIGHAGGGAAGQRSRIERDIGELANRVGADITDVGDIVVAEIALNKQVPAFNVAAAHVCRGGIGPNGHRKRSKAIGNGRSGCNGNACRQRNGIVVWI